MKQSYSQLWTRFGISCALISLLFNFSCKDDPINTDNNDNEDTEFLQFHNYATAKDYVYDIDLNLVKGQEIGSIHYHIFAEDPFVYVDGVNTEMLKTDVSPIEAGYTCPYGCATGVISMPVHTDQVYIVSMSIGAPHVVIGEIAGNTIRGYAREQVSPDNTTKSTKSNNSITAPNTSCWFGWDNSGVPNNLLLKDNISSQLLMDLSYTLPEGVSILSTHPSWVQSNTTTSLQLIAQCSIDLTFVYEGAGFLNTVGYYYYPTGNPPTNLNNYPKYVAFPNASLPGSGGNLAAGSKIKLKYWDGTHYTDTFPANTTVAWFLFSNGYTASPKYQVSPGYYTICSNPSLNPESNPTLKQHNILINDTIGKHILVSFEDMRRDQGSDNDFNDVIFYATPNPFSAASITNIPNLPVYKDTDGDDVPDQFDEFPNDPKLAHTVHYPGNLQTNPNAWGTLAFEDLWPCAGDYDMNDQVVQYNIVNYTNAQNNVVHTTGTLNLQAIGAKYKNGFGMQLGISPNTISSISIKGGNMNHNTFKLQSNGTESGQSKANIIFWDDAFAMFNSPAGLFINTDMNKNKVAYKTVSFQINYTTPQYPGNLTTPPFNPYIIIDSGSGTRAKEVHLAGFKPTDLADKTLFSTCNDKTNIGLNRYYVGANNMPFALSIPAPFIYPKETLNIKNAYLHFWDWTLSNGSSYKDWYFNTASGYRNNSNLYTK